MNFFGEAIELVDAGYSDKRRRGPQNLLDLLPDVFTYGDAGRMRLRLGIKNGTLSKMISNWKSRDYIEPLDTDCFKYSETSQFRKHKLIWNLILNPQILN